MKAPMHRRTPSIATSSSSMLYRNSSSFFISSSSSNDNDSNEQFDFSIIKELLLDSNEIVLGGMIGEGSYSIVHKGLFRDQVPVAVKIMTSAVSIHQKEKFQKEVLLLSSMKHDNIVKLVGACIQPRLMIVTELLEGGTLGRFMWNYSPKLLDLKMSLSYALDISQAMEFLHSNGIIHRDINPKNVLVTGDLKHVKLADFGIAREEATDGMTCEAGTYTWMAPEVCSPEPLRIMEKKHYDHKVDVYSFALVFWKLLTNKTPFDGVPRICIPYLINQGQRPSLSHIPDGAKSIIESCWAMDSNARPEFKEITVLLKNLLSSLCSDTSSDKILPEEEAYDADTEYSIKTVVIHDEESDCEVETPKEEEKKKKKKRVKKMIFPFVKMFRACYKPVKPKP